MNISRYPGTKPFSEDHKDVFFGREDDVKSLRRHVTLNNLTVLHGKSGLGKSSLVNAGLVPNLQAYGEYHCLFVRFTAYSTEDALTLLQRFEQSLKIGVANNYVLHHELGLSTDSSNPWLLIKEWQYSLGLETRLLVIMDQFEEIFTYPIAQIESLANAISQCLYNKIPEDIQNRLLEFFKPESTYKSSLSSNALDFLGNTRDTHFLIGIRSDKLGLLGRIKRSLPNIMSSLYELTPLNRGQAYKAIMFPAQKKDGSLNGPSFETSPFYISEDLSERLLNYLSQENTKPIETFLLQVICSHIEDLSSQKTDQSTDGDIRIQDSDLPRLDEIIKKYYSTILSRLGGQSNANGRVTYEYILIRFLVETILIDFQNGHRISIDKNYLHHKGIEDHLLKDLIDSRLLRREPNSLDGVNFELSHDILIEAVRLSMLEMKSLKNEIRAYYQDYVNKKVQKVIERLFLSSGYKKVSELDLQKGTDSRPLLDSKILRSDENRLLEINPVFYDTSKEVQSEARVRKSLKQKKSFLIVLLFSIITVLSSVWALVQNNALKLSSDKLIVVRDSLRSTVEEVDDLYKASVVRSQKLDSLRARANDQLEIAIINERIADSSSRSASKLALSLQDEMDVRAQLESDQRKRDIVNNLLGTIRYLEFRDDDVLIKAKALDTMLTEYRKYDNREREILIHKTSEAIQKLNRDAFLLDNLEERVTAINTLEGRLVVATSKKIRFYAEQNTSDRRFNFGFKAKGCVSESTRDRLLCYSQKAEFRVFSANDSSLRLEAIGRITSVEGVNKIIPTNRGMLLLDNSGDLFKLKETDSYYSIDGDTLNSKVRAIADGNQFNVVLKNGELFGHKSLWEPPVRSKQVSSEYSYLFKIAKNKFLLASKRNSPLELDTLFLTRSLSGSKYKYIKGVQPGSNSSFAVYNNLTVSIHSRVLDNTPMLELAPEEAISFVVHLSDAFYVGTDGGQLFRLTYTLNNLHTKLQQLTSPKDENQ